MFNVSIGRPTTFDSIYTKLIVEFWEKETYPKIFIPIRYKTASAAAGGRRWDEFERWREAARLYGTGNIEKEQNPGVRRTHF